MKSPLWSKANSILYSLPIKKGRGLTTPNFTFWKGYTSTWKNQNPLQKSYLLISAFNKMQPHLLVSPLASHLNLSDQLLSLILNFLTPWSSTGGPQPRGGPWRYCRGVAKYFGICQHVDAIYKNLDFSYNQAREFEMGPPAPRSLFPCSSSLLLSSLLFLSCSALYYLRQEVM